MITVVGLSVAFACLLLIFLYVTQEFSYNNFHANRDKIFRVNYVGKFADGSESESVLLDPKLSKIVKEKVPEVKRSIAFRSAHGPTIIYKHHNFEEDLCITEPDFFDMFSFKLIHGNKDELLKNPDEIVITSSLAKKFQAISSCSIEELLGKSVTFMETGDQTFVISGIMEDVPKNSSFQFSALIPYKYEGAFPKSDTMFGNSSLFYEINEPENAANAEKQIIAVLKEHYQSLLDRFKKYGVFANTDDCFTPYSLSLNDIYLDKIDSDYEKNNSKTSLYILSAIGLLILIIACSNFIMLSLGQSFKKAGEVGVRKTMGAKKRDVFSLFFTESLILSLISLVFGTVLCVLLLPEFKNLAQNEIYTELINIPVVSVFVTACMLLLVFLTSIIPVIKLAKIQPNLLASKKLNLGKRSDVSHLFVTLQYGLSIFLIILTIAIVRQTNYMKYRDLGFSTKNIIDLRIYHLNNSDKLTLRDQLKTHPGIINLTLTDRNYTGGRSSEFVKSRKGENVDTRILNVDHHYISTLNLNLVQGENFSEANSGGQSIIVNEKLMGFLDFKESPIGQSINMNGKEYQIIGVVKDYNFDSAKEEIKPLILFPRTESGDRGKYIFIKYHPAQLTQIIPFIKETWGKNSPDKELDIQFWDEQLNQRYQAEERWSQIIGYAAIIAIIISSLGLFGLTLLVINRRIKEIGIRKINGAKVFEVLAMLNKGFIKWVAIAFIIATPIAYFAMNKWLENFAYKTELNWWIFALAGLLALGIALITVSWQSWRAATRNPVEALRYE